MMMMMMMMMMGLLALGEDEVRVDNQHPSFITFLIAQERNTRKISKTIQ